MVKDICWEGSETVIPDLPAWLNIALKSQLTGHKAGDSGPTLLLNRVGKGTVFIFFIAMLRLIPAYGT